MNMGKVNLNEYSDGNIIFPKILEDHGFETKDSMKDEALDFVYGRINHRVDDMRYTRNNVIICPNDRNFEKN